jgi:hypothetical protein
MGEQMAIKKPNKKGEKIAELYIFCTVSCMIFVCSEVKFKISSCSDIKCANILVHANGSVKLTDFGLAKEVC